MIKPKAAEERGSIPTKGGDKRHASSHFRITVLDMEGTPTSLFSADEPLLTSAERAWNGITVEEHHLPPTEFPERTADSHLIAMHLRPATLVWFLSGHPQTKRMRRGSLDILPQGAPLGGYSKNETESLMLALDPSLVDRVANEMGATYHVELIRSLGIRDPQIEHICLALKAELETDCPSGRLYGDALAVALAAHLLARYAAHTDEAKQAGAGSGAWRRLTILRRHADETTSRG